MILAAREMMPLLIGLVREKESSDIPHITKAYRKLMQDIEKIKDTDQNLTVLADENYLKTEGQDKF